MRRWPMTVLLAGCLALGLVADAGASSQLPRTCGTWFGPHVLALICDPAGQSGAALKIEAPGDTARGEAGTGIAQLPGGEPFQDGDRVAFTLDGASANTVVALRAASSAGIRTVVITRFDPPAGRYDVQIDGDLARVTTDSGQARTLTIAPPAPPLRVSTGTPVAAVRSFVRAVGSDRADLEVACQLLSRTAYTLLNGDGNCPALLGLVLFDEEVETYPDLVSIEARRVRVQRGRPTIAKAELVYRFDPSDRYEPRVVRVWATVAVAREPAGWRVLLPEVVSPGTAIDGDSDLTPAEVREHLKRQRAGVREVRARARNRRRATRTMLVGSTACSGSARSKADPERDVKLADGGDLARRQDESGVDLVEASQSRVGLRMCFELRFRAPVPSELGLNLWLVQRAPIRQRVILAGSVRVDISGEIAAGSRDVIGGRYFPARVTISPARDRIRVEARDTRGWPMIDPQLRYRFAVEAWTEAPAIDNAYLDQLGV